MKITIKNLLILIIATALNSSFCMAKSFNEMPPQDMTCQQFIDLNPEFRSSIAFWVVNKKSDLRASSYVSLNEVNITWIPKIMKECEKNRKLKLGKLQISS